MTATVEGVVWGLIVLVTLAVGGGARADERQVGDFEHRRVGFF